ncbi:unnamed protein product, partial [Arabidopsis halleri]
KKLWALHIPPKLKTFWWRVLHNAIPVTDNIARREVKISSECLFCGDAKETTEHLPFKCSFSYG